MGFSIAQSAGQTRFMVGSSEVAAFGKDEGNRFWLRLFSRHGVEESSHPTYLDAQARAFSHASRVRLAFT